MLELFQTNQPQLSQWLQEKDLMMSVLGPLSMDPNMLNTQKQQVQVRELQKKCRKNTATLYMFWTKNTEFADLGALAYAATIYHSKCF